MKQKAMLRGGALLPVLRTVLVVGIAAALLAPLFYLPPSGVVSPGVLALVFGIATTTLALVVFGLLVGMGPAGKRTSTSGKAAKAAPNEARVANRPPRPGAGHHVLEVGVGRRNAILLNDHGIITTNDLVRADADELTRITGAELGRVEDWQAAARLLTVPGIGSHDAMRLVQHGIRTPGQLAGHEPDTLARRLGTDPGTAARWIDAAESRQGVRMERTERPTEPMVHQHQH